MGVGGTTTYPDRAIRVAFTRPFIDSGISVLVSKKSGIKSIKDLDQDKYTIANLNNPQMADRAKRYFPKTKVLTFDTPAAQFLAVKSGRANALQIDTPSAEYWAAHNTDEMEVLPGLLGASQNNGIFLRTGDFKWWLWLDTTVAEMRTGSWYPQYSEIYHKWFGKNPPPQKFYIQQ
jgi:polar amino acid transport system substrate-binding protein